MSWLGRLFSFGKREPERVAMTNLFQAFEGDSMNFKQLDRHLLVVGQSGSGKSYFIGKMVEELALPMNTLARVVILDRAGDFVKIGLSSDENNLSDILPAVHSNWSDREFERQFSKNQFQRLAFHPLAVHPYWFDALDLCAVFGLPYNHAYWGPIAEAQRNLVETYNIQSLVTELGKTQFKTYANLDGVASLTEGLFTRHSDPLYVKRYGEASLSGGFYDTPQRVVENELPTGDKCSDRGVVHVIDLSSLEGEHARCTLALAVLRALWKASRKQWWYRHMTKKKAPRTATFVVVDEAHHLCPAERMESPIGIRVREAILEIATEGRKYGLWLVLGTQRPTRLHPTVLAEMSNFMLMRTTSSADLEFLSKLLSNDSIKSDLAKLERKQGWGFLAGEWARDGYEKVKVSSRQTAHIEGSFEDGEWISRR